MSKEIYELDAVAAANIFAAADGGAPEGMSRSVVNDSMREHMATLRRHYDDPEWIAVRIQGPLAGDIGVYARTGDQTFTINLAGVDLKGYFTDGRIVKIIDGGGTGVDLITQCSGNAVYSNPLTTVTIKATDTIHATQSTDAQTYHSSIARGLSLQDVETDFYIPATADDEGVQTASDAAALAGGGTVLMTHAVYAFNAVVTVPDGGVNFLAASRNCTVTADGSSNLSELFNLSDASEPVSFNGITFDANHAGQSSGNNYGVNIAAAAAPLFADCTFEDCRIGAYFGDTDTARSKFVRCNFTAFRLYGIGGNSATNTFKGGSIIDCDFDGASMDETDPAGIYLAGSWRISGGTMTNMGHASLAPRGVWLYNKTGTTNGAYKSRVSEMEIDCSNASNGTGIEAGADYCSVSDNVVELSATTGTGINLISRTGGQIIDGLSVTGNTVKNGALGISANDLIRNSGISGNTINIGVGGTGLFMDGTALSVVGNFVEGGAKGIEFAANAVGCVASANYTNSATTAAISVLAGASGTILTRNIDKSSTAVIVDAGTSTDRNGNTGDLSEIESYDEALLSSTTSETDAAVITEIDLPSGGKAGKYLITLDVYRIDAQDANFVFEIYTGTTGDMGDTSRGTLSLVNTDVFRRLSLTLTASDSDQKIGLSTLELTTAGVTKYSVTLRVRKISTE